MIKIALILTLVLVGCEQSKHCGCNASPKGCEEPCFSCCGPHGYADCFSGTNPGSIGCCAAKR